MKKIFFMTIMALLAITTSFAQTTTDKKQAEIKFEKTVHEFGTFSESAPKVTCVFNFTNEGSLPLVINQAIGSCGCTVAEYPKAPIKPGESGQIKVTYNGAGKFPGHFKKSITVRTNGAIEMTRLYVQGNMEEAKK